MDKSKITWHMNFDFLSNLLDFSFLIRFLVPLWPAPWLEMEGWGGGVLLSILPTEGRGFGCGFSWFVFFSYSHSQL